MKGLRPENKHTILPSLLLIKNKNQTIITLINIPAPELHSFTSQGQSDGFIKPGHSPGT